jgi:alpha-galactosidase
MSKETLKTLTNKEVIAVNQDRLGIQGFRFSNENNMEIWAKPLDNNEWALVFINMSSQPVSFDYNWKKHPLEDDLGKRWTNFEKETFNIRDLFNHKDLGNTQTPLRISLASHDVLMVRLKK